MRSRAAPTVLRAVIATCVLASIVITATPANARSPREIRQRDDCEATSFNAALGPGACITNGSTTFDEFNAELAQRRSVGAWKFNPDNTDVRDGDQVLVVNRGGETHTFTKVAAFGGGFVPILNQMSGNLVPVPECAAVRPDGTLTPQPAGPNNMFVPAQTSAPLARLSDGTAKYQCCIHPWMRVQINHR
jgi:plastocyanin